MYEHLPVLPHARFLPPKISQPIKFFGIPGSNEMFAFQLLHQPVQIGAIFAEIYSVTVRRAVVEGRQKIRQRGKFSEELRLPPLMDCGDRKSTRLNSSHRCI